MDKETFLNKITEIGTCQDDVQRRTMLTEISDEVSKVYDENTNNTTLIDTLNQTIEKNNTDLENLREANMQLFLRVGTNKTASQMTEDSTGIEQPESNKRKFEDLFKEENK